MEVNYNIRVLHTSDNDLNALVVGQHLLPCPSERVTGAAGEVYRPNSTLIKTLKGVSDFEFRVGHTVITTQLYAMPPEEYAAVVAGSPGFQFHCLHHLTEPLTNTLDPAARRDWQHALAAGMTQKPATDRLPNVLPTQPITAATWLPEHTRLIRNKTGWLLVLYCEVVAKAPRLIINRSAVGIDVGTRTLAVASHKCGLIHKARGITDVSIDARTAASLLPNRPDLHDRLVRMSTALQYTAARTELTQFLEIVLAGGTIVGFEKLNYQPMTPSFPKRARDLGLRDFLAVWLPQRLRLHGLHGQPVTPDRTSITCNMTYLPGLREGDRLDIGSVDRPRWIDADENAASNIRDLALAEYIAYRVARLQKTA